MLLDSDIFIAIIKEEDRLSILSENCYLVRISKRELKVIYKPPVPWIAIRLNLKKRIERS